MTNLPTGTVTFLFTDIQGSTQLLHRLGDSYGEVLEQHRQLLRQAFADHNGHEVDTQGDAFFVAFQRGGDAVAATVAAQRALHSHAWPGGEPLLVRMGLHTGEPQQSAGGYFGLDVHRGARVMSAGHGGQVLLSHTTHVLAEEHLPAGVTLRDLGEHRLKDLIRAEHLYDLVIEGLPRDFAPLKTLGNQPNNLPVQMTSFVGREAQIEVVKELLAKTHLLTLTGAGGTGKTRLSLQVGADVLDKYADGVWLVEFAPVSDPALLPQAIASALGAHAEAGQSLTQALSKHLASKKLLLILDNCEHVLSEAAQLANELLRSCPGLRILASSREGLGIAGEQIYRVPSLSFPNLRETATPETLGQYEAVRLFVERASAVSSGFALTADNASALAQLCSRLDGIPLAIELAAARVKVLSVEKLLERLDDRFRLLTGGSRTALPRQQTLRALIDWSYELLVERERALLRRLSVFAGGWTLEAAESVCADEMVEEWEVLDLLTSLVDKSLAVYEEESERYRLLETVRQYSRDRLLESGEQEVAAVRERHLHFFLQVAEDAKPQLSGPQQLQWLNRLEQEHDNMRAALAWCKGHAQGAESGLRLGTALFGFWLVRGYWSEGREHLSTFLAGAGAQVSQNVRARALGAAGEMAIYQGDYVCSHALLEESLVLFRELGDKEGVANSLANLGAIAHNQGDFARDYALSEESLVLFRELGDKHGVANSLAALGSIMIKQGDYARALALSEESLVLFRELGDKQGVAESHGRLGAITYYQGDYVRARALMEESLVLFRELGSKQDVARSLRDLANVAVRQYDFTRARALMEESLVLFRELGSKQDVVESHGVLGDIAFFQGDCARARVLEEEYLAMCRELGDKFGVATALYMLGNIALYQGDYARARVLAEEGLAMRRELGDKRGVANSLINLGRIVQRQGDTARARAFYEESLLVSREIGYAAIVANALVHLGYVGYEQGEANARDLVEEGLRLYHDIDEKLAKAIVLGICAHIAVQWNATDLGPGDSSMQRAVRLRGAAEALRESISSPLSAVGRAEVDKDMDAARATLGEDAFEAAWNAGRAMSPEQAINYALEEASA